MKKYCKQCQTTTEHKPLMKEGNCVWRQCKKCDKVTQTTESSSLVPEFVAEVSQPAVE